MRPVWMVPVAVAVALGLGGCRAALGDEDRTDKPAGSGAAPAASEVRPTEDEDLVIGIHQLQENGVIDGDTLRVVGLRKSVRLILIDTEERFHPTDPPELQSLMRTDFDAYSERMNLGKHLPVKYPTPLGDAATAFAKAFFEGCDHLRLEVDVKGQGSDTYGRSLGYAWAVYGDDRAPRLYNLEAVRAGMSPYYVKYGRSRRFDAAFREAQREAREAQRGIWDPALHHYRDYEARLAWWGRRAEALDRYRRVRDKLGPEGAPWFIEDRKVIRQLLKHVGEEVTVLGLVDDHDARAILPHEDGATLRIGGQFFIEVEVQGTELAKHLDVKRYHGEYVVVSGVLDRLGSPLGGKSKNRYMRIPVSDAAHLRWGHELPVE